MLFVFELEGVLCDTKVLHYRALNLALRPFGVTVPWREDASPACYHDAGILDNLDLAVPPGQQRQPIWQRKQAIAFELIRDYPFHVAYRDWRRTFEALARKGHRLACCAWEHPKVLMSILSSLGLLDMLDVVLSAHDAKHPPPHPEMIWDAMTLVGALPHETLVVVADDRDIPGVPNVVRVRNARLGAF